MSFIRGITPSGRRKLLVTGTASTIGIFLAHRYLTHDPRTTELWRTVGVFSVCKSDWMVDHSGRLLELAMKVPVLSDISRTIIRKTFAAQFLGGESLDECDGIIKRLHARGIGSLLSYSVEAEGSHIEGEKEDTGVIEEYFRAVDACEEAEKQTDQLASLPSTWLAIKLTGMIQPEVLERISNTILMHRASVSSRPTRGIDHPGTPLNEDHAIFRDADVPVLDGPACRAGLATEADVKAIKELYMDLRLLICKAGKSKMRVLMDAEHSWYQAVTDALTQLLAMEFNAPDRQPVIYATYQAYLRRHIPHLESCIRHAREHQYSLGIKMVRGAYHEQEQIAWRDTHGQDSLTPVWIDKQETDQAYDTAVELLLSHLARPEPEPKIAVLFATHNEKSLDLILTGLKRHDLIDIDAKGLWTLKAPHSVVIAQLYGMRDDLAKRLTDRFSSEAPSIAMKYIPYGPLDRALPYLIRRAVENKSMLGGEGGACVEVANAWSELQANGYGLYLK